MYFEFMRIVILLFQQFYVAVADNCECEVEPWNEWSVADATCGPAMQRRQRVCSSVDGWTLGLTCHVDDHIIKYDSRDVVLPACRKLNLDVKLLKKLFVHYLFMSFYSFHFILNNLFHSHEFQRYGRIGLVGHLVLKLVDSMGNRYEIENAYLTMILLMWINARALKTLILWINKNRIVTSMHVVSCSLNSRLI